MAKQPEQDQKTDPMARIEAAIADINAAAEETYSSEAAIRAILEGKASVPDSPSTEPKMPRVTTLSDIMDQYVETPATPQKDVSAETLTRIDQHVKNLNKGNFVTRHPLFTVIGAGIVATGLLYGASEDFRKVVSPVATPIISTAQQFIKSMQENFALKFPDQRP